jgi:hypothetical protein
MGGGKVKVTNQALETQIPISFKLGDNTQDFKFPTDYKLECKTFAFSGQSKIPEIHGIHGDVFQAGFSDGRVKHKYSTTVVYVEEQYQVVGGGCIVGDAANPINASLPHSGTSKWQGWKCTAWGAAAEDMWVDSYAIGCRIGPPLSQKP